MVSIESVTQLLVFVILLTSVKISTTEQVNHEINKLTYVSSILIESIANRNTRYFSFIFYPISNFIHLV